MCPYTLHGIFPRKAKPWYNRSMEENEAARGRSNEASVHTDMFDDDDLQPNANASAELAVTHSTVEHFDLFTNWTLVSDKTVDDDFGDRVQMHGGCFADGSSGKRVRGCFGSALAYGTGNVPVAGDVFTFENVANHGFSLSGPEGDRAKLVRRTLSLFFCSDKKCKEEN